MTVQREDSVVQFVADEKWIVFVHEKGNKSRNEFRFREQAQSFADGQRTRLGLKIPDTVVRRTAFVPKWSEPNKT